MQLQYPLRVQCHPGPRAADRRWIPNAPPKYAVYSLICYTWINWLGDDGRRRVDASRALMRFFFAFGSELPGVVRVIPGTLLRLRTTHSWEFLGLAEDGRETPAWSSAKLGADTIIGNIDTGTKA